MSSRLGSNSKVVVVVVTAAALVFVAMAGILVIAVPDLLNAMQRSRQKRTVADIQAIASAVEAYAVDRHHYPPPRSLKESLVPAYIAMLPSNDVWANPIRYQCWNSSGSGPCNEYAIGSGGRDGAFRRDDLKTYTGAEASSNFNDDIVLRNGRFTRYPTGAGNAGLRK